MALITGLPDFFNTSRPANYDIDAAHRAILQQLGGTVRGKRNYITSSEDAASWGLTGVTVTSNTTLNPGYDEPDTLTADTVTASAGLSLHRIAQGLTLASGNHTFSVYLKAGSYRYVKFRTSTQGDGINIDLNGAAGAKVVGATGSITYSEQEVRQSFTRFSFTFTKTTCDGVVVALTDSNFNETWTAAGTETIRFWGAQGGEGDGAGVYVKTTSVTVNEGDYTQLPGNLDTNNISTGCRFSNNHKAEPFSFFFVGTTQYVEAAATAAISQPIFPPFMTDSIVLSIMTMDVAASKRITGGTFELFLNGSTLGDFRFPLSYRSAADAAVLGLGFSVRAGDTLWVDPKSLTLSAALVEGDRFVWNLYCKTQHSR